MNLINVYAMNALDGAGLLLPLQCLLWAGVASIASRIAMTAVRIHKAIKP